MQSRDEVLAGLQGLTQAEIIAYGDLVQSVILEILSELGMDAEALEARRAEILARENAFIDSEIEKYGGAADTNPLPPPEGR